MNPQYFESSVKVGLVHMPLRSTLLPLREGAVLISPIKFSQDQLTQLSQFNVTDIVAPSDIHHLFVGEAHQHFPRARLWKTAALEKKRPDIKWTHSLGKDPWPHTEIKIEELKGVPNLHEFVFFHAPSKTLVVTDLVFNLMQPPGVRAKIIYSIMGTYNGLAMSRLWNFFMKDKPAFISSAKKVFEWNFDRLVMAHGEIVEQNAKQLLRGCLAERGYSV